MNLILSDEFSKIALGDETAMAVITRLKADEPDKLPEFLAQLWRTKPDAVIRYLSSPDANADDVKAVFEDIGRDKILDKLMGVGAEDVTSISTIFRKTKDEDPNITQQIMMTRLVDDHCDFLVKNFDQFDDDFKAELTKNIGLRGDLPDDDPFKKVLDETQRAQLIALACGVETSEVQVVKGDYARIYKAIQHKILQNPSDFDKVLDVINGTIKCQVDSQKDMKTLQDICVFIGEGGLPESDNDLRDLVATINLSSLKNTINEFEPLRAMLKQVQKEGRTKGIGKSRKQYLKALETMMAFRGVTMAARLQAGGEPPTLDAKLDFFESAGFYKDIVYKDSLTHDEQDLDPKKVLESLKKEALGHADRLTSGKIPITDRRIARATGWAARKPDSPWYRNMFLTISQDVSDLEGIINEKTEYQGVRPANGIYVGEDLNASHGVTHNLPVLKSLANTPKGFQDNFDSIKKMLEKVKDAGAMDAYIGAIRETVSRSWFTNVDERNRATVDQIKAYGKLAGVYKSVKSRFGGSAELTGAIREMNNRLEEKIGSDEIRGSIIKLHPDALPDDFKQTITDIANDAPDSTRRVILDQLHDGGKAYAGVHDNLIILGKTVDTARALLGWDGDTITQEPIARRMVSSLRDEFEKDLHAMVDGMPDAERKNFFTQLCDQLNTELAKLDTPQYRGLRSQVFSTPRARLVMAKSQVLINAMINDARQTPELGNLKQTFATAMLKSISRTEPLSVGGDADMKAMTALIVNADATAAEAMIPDLQSHLPDRVFSNMTRLVTQQNPALGKTMKEATLNALYKQGNFSRENVMRHVGYIMDAKGKSRTDRIKDMLQNPRINDTQKVAIMHQLLNTDPEVFGEALTLAGDFAHVCLAYFAGGDSHMSGFLSRFFSTRGTLKSIKVRDSIKNVMIAYEKMSEKKRKEVDNAVKELFNDPQRTGETFIVQFMEGMITKFGCKLEMAMMIGDMGGPAYLIKNTGLSDVPAVAKLLQEYIVQEKPLELLHIRQILRKAKFPTTRAKMVDALLKDMDQGDWVISGGREADVPFGMPDQPGRVLEGRNAARNRVLDVIISFAKSVDETRRNKMLRGLAAKNPEAFIGVLQRLEDRDGTKGMKTILTDLARSYDKQHLAKAKERLSTTILKHDRLSIEEKAKFMEILDTSDKNPIAQFEARLETLEGTPNMLLHAKILLHKEDHMEKWDFDAYIIKHSNAFIRAMPADSENYVEANALIQSRLLVAARGNPEAFEHALGDISGTSYIAIVRGKSQEFLKSLFGIYAQHRSPKEAIEVSEKWIEFAKDVREKEDASKRLFSPAKIKELEKNQLEIVRDLQTRLAKREEQVPRTREGMVEFLGQLVNGLTGRNGRGVGLPV